MSRGVFRLRRFRPRRRAFFFSANIQAGSPTAAAGAATVSGAGASTAAATATAAAGTSTVSAIGATAPAAGTANAVPAAGISTVSAVGAARFASTASVAAGTSTVSAAGAARVASSASVIAGTCTVGAAGSTVANVQDGSAVPAAGTSTVSAIGGAVGTLSSNAIPAAGVATVAAGAGSTAITVGTPKSELKPLFADRVQPRPQDFAAVIDSYADFSPALRSWSQSVTGASGVLRVRSPSSAEFMPLGTVAEQLAGATTTAQAVGILGASTIGDIVFRATSTAQAQTALGAGTVGAQVFGMATTAQFAALAVQTLSAATVAEVSAATATAVYVSPGTLVSHPGFAKAWCWFSVTAGVVTLRSNYNISEVSAVSTGRFRFFMGTSMSLTAYAVIGTHSGEYTEDNTNIGYGYAPNVRLKKLDRFDVFFGRPLGGSNTNPAGMNDGEFYVAAYGWR